MTFANSTKMEYRLPSRGFVRGIHRLRLFALLALLLVAACAGMPERPTPPPTREQLAEVEARLFDFVGEERARLNGQAKALLLDPELAMAARAHSEAMAEKRAFDSGPVEENVAIQHLMANPKFYGYVGENSAMQYFTPEAPFDPEELARIFLGLWLNSGEHRSHIQSPAFARTGIGVAANGNELYAAQVFAGELPPPPRGVEASP
jgi:uncharacterized protein YkwD